MTTTLIVLLIITLLAMIFLPFSRALMKDRSELHENPMEEKFNILLTRINDLLMNGNGEVVKFKNDPRMLNLFDDNHANMIINFFYSTGSLTITLKYKYYHVELVKKMQFDNMRQAETFRQQDVANHFCEEATIAIREHQTQVERTQGFTTPSGNLYMNPSCVPSELFPEREMYSHLSKEQKLELLNMARIVFIADGSPMEEFRESGALRKMLLNLQIDFDTYDREVATRPTYIDMKHIYAVDNTITVISLLPVVACSKRNPDMRMEALYKVFAQINISREQVDAIIQKMSLIMERFDI